MMIELTRREFLAGGAAVAAASTFAEPKTESSGISENSN
jgi:hypothetical protein